MIGVVNLVIAKAGPASLSADLSESPMAAMPEDAALAIAEVALGLFARLTWPMETFN
jgi:hypothetical protein